MSASSGPAGSNSSDKSSKRSPQNALAQPVSKPGLAAVLRASTSGEAVSAHGVLSAVGGVRGIVEAVLPSSVFLVSFVLTQDPRISVIAPVVVSIVAVVARLFARQTTVSAFSGLFGVFVCALATLFTGRGETYFLPGFIINGAWVLGLSASLIARWPVVGLILGGLRGSFTEWRSEPILRRAATVCTWIWLGVFCARLAVQLPLFFAAQGSQPGAIEALGLARIVMGIPLFALAALLTWLIMSRVTDALRMAALSHNTGDNSDHQMNDAP